MSNDLRDQLLKAGLVTEAQVREAEAPRPRREPDKGKKPSNAKARKPRRQADGDAAKPRARKPVQKEPTQTPSPTPHLDKAQREAVRTFLREKRQNVADAPLPYNFLDGRAVKKLWITAEQQAALGTGELVIVSRNERHYLIGRTEADTLLTLDPKAVVIRADARTSEEEDPAYKDHPIPDDLVW